MRSQDIFCQPYQGKYFVGFFTNDPNVLTLIENLPEKDVDIDIKPHKEKRSLDANAYFHVLVGKIAEVLGASITEIKNDMISQYGQFHYLPDGNLDFSVKPMTFDYRNCDTEHLKPTSKTVEDKNGNPLPVFIVMRGSHTYDTKEMSRLIDGTVYEATNLGIQTLPSEQIQRMESLWNSGNQ